MPHDEPHLAAVHPATAPDSVLSALARHREALRAEQLPDDPPRPLEALVAGLRRQDPASASFRFVLWDRGAVVGSAALRLPSGQNTHLAFVELSVLAPYQRRGLGRRLLAEVLRCAEEQGRSPLTTNASSLLPAGEAVLRHLGAALVMEQHFLQLDLQTLPPDLLDRWRTDGQSSAPDYELWPHAGAYPEERLAEIAELSDVMHTAPSGTRDLQTSRTTPEALRAGDAALREGSQGRLTTFAVHRPSGRLVALSELYWETARPSLLFQHATAVRPEHRRHRLGRWIKAANLDAAIRANTQARVVRAGNTPDNVGMLAINQALGFRTSSVHTDWQSSTAALRTWLHGR